jgi:ABC-2 type transport system ATP-binding protein
MTEVNKIDRSGAPPAGTVSEHLVEARRLSKRFGDQDAVKDVSFYVPQGAIFGFIGPSGCGKTTTVRLLTGTYLPSDGEAWVFQRHPADFTRSDRERIGYMPQHFVLYPDLSVWENLNFAASIYGVSWVRGKRLNELLKFVELSEHKNKLVKNISGGMMRRLSLAATLVHRPSLLFLDEPTAGIDPVLRRKFWDFFDELRKSGVTLFVTTQYVSEAAYCDLVGVMDRGRLLLVDTPEGLRRRALGGEVVDMRLNEPVGYERMDRLRALPFVQGPVTLTDDYVARLVVDEASTAMPALMDWSKDQRVVIESIQEYLPPFDDVFVHLIQGDRHSGNHDHAQSD